MSKRGKGKNPDYSVPLLDPRERGVTSPGVRSKYHGTLHDGTELDVIVKAIPDDDQASIALYKSRKKSPHKHVILAGLPLRFGNTIEEKQEPSAGRDPESSASYPAIWSFGRWQGAQATAGDQENGQDGVPEGAQGPQEAHCPITAGVGPGPAFPVSLPRSTQNTRSYRFRVS